MIDPITETLLSEIPSDLTIQSQFKELINKETEKCEKIAGSPGFAKCKSLATSYAVKKFLNKFGNSSDKVVEMVIEKLYEMRNV